MYVDAELHPDVLADLKHSFSEGDTADFFRQLEIVCRAPIKNSDWFHDKKVGRYVFRRFSFGVGVERIAIFHFDGKTVRVIKCRLSKPRRRRKPDDIEAEEPP